MAKLHGLAVLRRRHCTPEPMDASRRHLTQVFDMLGAANLGLEEGRTVVDAKRLELPEDDGRVFWGKLLVASIIFDRAG